MCPAFELRPKAEEILVPLGNGHRSDTNSRSEKPQTPRATRISGCVKGADRDSCRKKDSADGEPSRGEATKDELDV